MHFKSLIRDLPENLGKRKSFGEIPCSLNGNSKSVDSFASVLKLDRKGGDASLGKALSLVPPQFKVTDIRSIFKFLPSQLLFSSAFVYDVLNLTTSYNLQGSLRTWNYNPY
jgi:hypothetical protein